MLRLLIALLAATAATPDVATDAAATLAALEKPKEKLVCRTETIPNSRFAGPKTCHTAKEWAAFYRDHDDVKRQLRDAGAFDNPH